MSIVKYSPFNSVMRGGFDVDSFLNNRWFGESDVLWRPMADIIEKEQSYEIKVDVPGMKKDDINISIKDSILTLSGEKTEEHEEENRNFFRKERAYGKFERSFRVPQDIDPDSIKAKYEDGVLTVEVPKSEKSKHKEIAIH